MEQVTLGGTAATGAYVVSRLLLSHAASDWGKVMDLGEDVFEYWHLAAAIPIGLVCGVTGMLCNRDDLDFSIDSCFFVPRSRRKTKASPMDWNCNRSYSRRFSTWVVRLSGIQRLLAAVCALSLT
jgi:hypothetical protein